MTYIRAYDRAGAGFNFGWSGESPIGGSGVRSTFISEQYLGNDRYYLEYTLTGSPMANEMTILAYVPGNTLYLRAVSYEYNGYSVLDIWNTNISLSDFAENGDTALLRGNDSIIGNSYADRINAQTGNDTITGNAGNDYLAGGAGYDRLLGGSGADILSGGSENDRLVGSLGNDRLGGGSGADRFVFGNASGADSIMDFQNGTDRIEVAGTTSSFRQIRVYDRGADAEIRFDNNIITLKNFDHRAIDASDFIFV